jgi:hypothetical protein
MLPQRRPLSVIEVNMRQLRSLVTSLCFVVSAIAFAQQTTGDHQSPSSSLQSSTNSNATTKQASHHTTTEQAVGPDIGSSNTNPPVVGDPAPPDPKSQPAKVGSNTKTKNRTKDPL